MADRPTVTAEELRGILAEEDRKAKKGNALDEDRLQEYSIAALATMRGLTRSDKLKVIRRMGKMLG